MGSKTVLILLGLTCIALGFFMIVQRAYYSSKYGRVIDYGEYHVLIGMFTISVGLLFIGASFRKQKK